MTSPPTAGPSSSPTPAAASPPVRYIKLGPGGRWAERSLRSGEIHLGHRLVPHELAARGDKEALVAFLVVCHSPRGELNPMDRADVVVWARRSLAETAVRNGLFDWLVERAG